jgi:hypothetical protein
MVITVATETSATLLTKVKMITRKSMVMVITITTTTTMVTLLTKVDINAYK